MKVVLVFLTLLATTYATRNLDNDNDFNSDNLNKNYFDNDFEFVDEDEKINVQQESKPIHANRKWIHDPSNDLCKPLNCKKKEVCLLEDAYTAVCVSKKELHKNKEDGMMKYIYLEEEAKRKADMLENTKDIFSQEDLVILKSQQNGNDLYDSMSAQNKGCKECPPDKPIYLCGSDNKTYLSMCRLDLYNCINMAQIKVICKGPCPCHHSEQSETTNSKHFYDNNNQHVTQYTFTSKDIKFDKKHRKNSRKNKPKVPNPPKLMDPQPETSQTINDCNLQDLTAIGNRLLDWFSVIMGDNKKFHYLKKLNIHFPSSCKTESKWMFGHLDTNSDGKLSSQELYDLNNDENEKCIKPFIEACDSNEDGLINPKEWCHCFEKTDRSCAAVRRRFDGNPIETYAPDCDLQGFYKPTQCHYSIGICWCVDKHGVEFANTRTRGRPNCDEIVSSATNDDEDFYANEDTNIEGSSDHSLF